MADIDLATLAARDIDAADHVVVVKEGAPGTEEMGKIPIAEMLPGPARFYAFNDMVSSTSGPEFVFQQSGTGAGVAARTGLADGGIGWVDFNLGTVATNRVACSVAQNTIRLGLGRAYFACRISQRVLSDATTTYTERFGFLDNVTAESSDGAFFRYTHSINGGRFEAVCRSNGVETAVDTGITVAGVTTYKLEVVVNAAGTSAEFFVNGASVATITTNIPTAAGRETGCGIMLLRSVGTAASTPVSVDYVLLEQVLTAAM